MSTSGTTWRLGRRPALDGLRGVAVLLVLASHAAVPGLVGGGQAGVTVFFVLSGFLITTLLLEEREGSGRISLRAFYARRSRRLVPAMLVTVALAIVVQVAIFGAFHDAELTIGTLGYFANYVMLSGHWFPHTSLGHTWSLAIEEQFYIVWPLLLLGLFRLKRAARMPAVAVALVAVVAWKWALWLQGASWERVYFGTDVRAEPLLMGCLLAFCMHGTRARRVSACWEVYGSALLVLAIAGSAQWGLTMLVVIAPTLVGLAGALVVYACVNDRAWWLAWGPLAYVGRRSYALYLFQGPVLTVMRDQSWVPRPVYWFGILPVLLVMADLSWRYVESPWLQRRSAPQLEQDRSPGGAVVHREVRRVRAAN